MPLIKNIILVSISKLISAYPMVTSIIVAIIIVGSITAWILSLKEGSERLKAQEADTAPEKISPEEPEAPQSPEEYEEENRHLMLNALTALGCQPQIQVDGSIVVHYQGNGFYIIFNGRYVRIWDPWCADIKADDPNLDKIREAVNKANSSFGPAILIGYPDQDNDIVFQSRYDIMLHPAIPELAAYIRAVFQSFFDIKQRAFELFAKATEAPATSSTRRPIGFQTNP